MDFHWLQKINSMVREHYGVDNTGWFRVQQSNIIS